MRAGDLGEWVDLAGDLLQEPTVRFRPDLLAQQLTHTFDVTAVSWNWRTSQRYGFEIYPDVGWRPQPDEQGQWDSGELLDRHPLVQWFAATGDPRPQSVGRVPTSVSGAADRAWLHEVLGPFDCEQQLSIPYLLAPGVHGAFVLARTGRDFTEVELALARRIQPLLRGLYLRAARPGVEPPADRAGLTAAELAVLGLLVEGHTAYGIGVRLGCSSRTVTKHLEHVYRKLDVHDRLLAVRVARERGLVER